MDHWHTKDYHEVLKELGTSEHGLSVALARQRLEKDGKNTLPEARPESLFSIFIGQFKSPLIYVLAAAAITLFWIGERTDGAIILFVLLFNAVIGTIQEGRAQRTLAAIKKLTQTTATVLRDGKEYVISDSEAVAGDVIILQEGERVPSDARIMTSNGLTIDEAALTGESVPVTKTPDRIHEVGAPLADRHNMAYKGTHVLAGNGTAVIVATGVKTVIGGITKTIAGIETEIPLRGDIRRLSRLIVVAVFVISIALFTFGLFYGKPVEEMFKTVVALTVSIIPEGLPIVLTLVLAAGVWRMSKHNVLVKKLQAVEALGQARVIAVDKTGTITKNEMVVEKVFAGGHLFEVSGVGYEPQGEVRLDGKAIEPLNHPDLIQTARIAALSSNARLSFVEESSSWRISGDPTEAALLVFAEKVGFKREALEQENPRIAEVPFNYNAKYHATMNREGKHNSVLVVGAPEVLLKVSSKFLHNGRSSELSQEEREKIESLSAKFAKEGLRVIGAAYIHDHTSLPFNAESIKNLTFVGLFAMRDALRPEARAAVLRSQSAGMRVVMITGDQKNAAQAIARDAGIFKNGDEVLTGADIDTLSDAELSLRLQNVSVFARVTPEHKLKIIRAYKARGEIVAMTGDGVNDAPSLVAADLGLAMGKIGTEVAKEAADIVILDDDFGSLVSGIEEGRSMYKTIKKVILYLFSTSIGEVLTITGALALGWPVPLLAAQIIWLNLITDSFLDAALAMDPKEEGLLSGKFRRPDKYLVDGLMVKRMILMSLPMMIGSLILFGLYLDIDPAKALTISLTTLAVFQWFNAWNCRSERNSIFHKGIFSNRFLVLATLIVITLQLCAVYTPFLQGILRTVPLNLSDWLIIIGVAASITVVEELRKHFYRKKHPFATASTLPDAGSVITQNMAL